MHPYSALPYGTHIQTAECRSNPMASFKLRIQFFGYVIIVNRSYFFAEMELEELFERRKVMNLFSRLPPGEAACQTCTKFHCSQVPLAFAAIN